MEIKIFHDPFCPEFFIKPNKSVSIPTVIKLPLECFLNELNIQSRTKSSAIFQVAILILIPIWIFIIIFESIIISFYCNIYYSRQCETSYKQCSSHDPNFFFDATHPCDMKFIKCFGDRNDSISLIHNVMIIVGVVATLFLVILLVLIFTTLANDCIYWKNVKLICEKWKKLFETLQINGQKMATLKKNKYRCFFSFYFSVTVVVFSNEFNSGNQIIFRMLECQVSMVLPPSAKSVPTEIQENRLSIVLNQVVQVDGVSNELEMSRPSIVNETTIEINAESLDQ